MPKSKLAVIQCADTGPLESLVLMLRALGYKCLRVGHELSSQLIKAGCDTVMTSEYLRDSMGYELPKVIDGVATPKDAEKCDLFVDVKAHRNLPFILNRFPSLEGKVLWYRINGGQPEHVVNARGDHGNEVDPPCPVVTPNQWYAGAAKCGQCHKVDLDADMWCQCGGQFTDAYHAYAFWPKFARADEFNMEDRTVGNFSHPVCLIHNAAGWGYQNLIEGVRKMGVEVLGRGSPDGLVHHSRAMDLLTSASCMVHLKSNDAPGYSLYEAIHSGCPIILPRRLIWRCRMEELFVENVTCLCFDRETHDPIESQSEIDNCLDEIRTHLTTLSPPEKNVEVASNAFSKLKELEWNEERDLTGFKRFIERHYGS